MMRIWVTHSALVNSGVKTTISANNSYHKLILISSLKQCGPVVTRRGKLVVSASSPHCDQWNIVIETLLTPSQIAPTHWLKTTLFLNSQSNESRYRLDFSIRIEAVPQRIYLHPIDTGLSEKADLMYYGNRTLSRMQLLYVNLLIPAGNYFPGWVYCIFKIYILVTWSSIKCVVNGN